jgi:hypothetical protein
MALLASSTVHAETAEETARAGLEAQLAALGDPRAFVATLAPDTLIIGNGSFALAGAPSALPIVGAFLPSRALGPVGVAKVTRLTADATDRAIWLDADVALGTMQVRRYGSVMVPVATAHVVELVVADGASWKVAALAYSSPLCLRAPGDTLGAPGNGALTKLLASPWLFHEDWRYRDARVERAIEVRGDGWGFAAGDVAIGGDPHAWWEKGLLVHALVVAIPDRDGKWQVVAVHVAE